MRLLIRLRDRPVTFNVDDWEEIKSMVTQQLSIWLVDFVHYFFQLVFVDDAQ